MSRGMGSHHSARALFVDWFTPPHVLAALGGADAFDLDAATHEHAPFRTARRGYTPRENGLVQPWDGRVWLNPPYTNADLHAFMARLAHYGRGTALIFARTETEAFSETVWKQAHACLFLRGRLHFHRLDGSRAKANAGAPSVLCAYGTDDMDILAVARSTLDGAFMPLRLPRSVVVAALEPTWGEVVSAILRRQRGPVALGELYCELARHPKAARNLNWRAKVRQTLARGGFSRVAPGTYEVVA